MLKAEAMKSYRINSLKTAFCFLTILPFREGHGGKPSDLEKAPPYFPWVGAVIGMGLFTLHYLLSGRIPVCFESLGLLLFWTVITGGLHLDGLADTADGCFSSRPQARILEIMKDSRIGTMGVLGLFFILAFKFSSLYYLCERPLAIVLFFSPVFGRFAMLAVMHHLSYAREKGVGGLFSKKKYGYQKGLLVPGIILVGLTGIKGILLICILVLLVWGYMIFLKKKISGYTGDTLGAVCELVETLTLIFWVIIF